MHLFYNASQILKMVILVDLSAMLLSSPLSILGWEFGKCMPFQSCSVLFRDLVNLLLSCLSQTKHFQYHNEYRMLRSFVRTLPFEFHQLLVWRQKTLTTQFI